MVARFLVVLFGFLALQCKGQERKDLVYGKLTMKEIVSAIKFTERDTKGEFIKIDNMGNGDPFPTIISYDKIESVASSRVEDTVRVSQHSFGCLFSILVSDSTLLKKNMTTSCGTFRFILHNGIQTWVFFADGFHVSKNYFETLQLRVGECDEEKIALGRISNVVRAFKVGAIRACK
jgi:hypothetical protein